jgi:hypothetical protein
MWTHPHHGARAAVGDAEDPPAADADEHEGLKEFQSLNKKYPEDHFKILQHPEIFKARLCPCRPKHLLLQCPFHLNMKTCQSSVRLLLKTHGQTPRLPGMPSIPPQMRVGGKT